MKGNLTPFPTIADLAVLAALAALTFYVDIGFFYPDVRLTESVSFPVLVPLMMWGLRIVTVLVGGTILYLYYGIRTGRVRTSSVVVTLVSLLLCALLAYPMLSYVYTRSFHEKIAEFHPYLQLSPSAYHERKSSSESPPFKLFCLGGSTTEFSDSHGRDWPSLTESKLKGAVPGRDVQVYNQGRQWYTTLHTLINYETNLMHLKPNVIIVMHSVNDLFQNADFSYFSIGPFRQDYGHFLGPIYRLIKQPTIFDAAKIAAPLMWYAPSREIIDTTHFPGLAAFKRNLHTLIRLAQAEGSKVVLLTQPYLFKDTLTADEKASLVMLNSEGIGPTKRWSPTTVKSGMEQYTAAVRQLAAETGSYLVDLEQIVPKSAEYLYDDVHYTDKAFDLIADYLAKKLQESDVLQ